MSRRATDTVKIGVFLAIAAFVVLAGLTIWRSGRVIRKQVEEEALVVVQANVKDVNAWVSRKVSVVDAAARYIEQRSNYRDGLTDFLKALAIADDDIVDLRLWVGSELVGSVSGWKPPQGFKPGSRPWFRPAMAKEEVSFTSIFRDDATRAFVFAVVRHAHLADREEPAMIVATVSLDSLNLLLSRMRMSGTGYGFLTDSESRTLAHPQRSVVFTRLDTHGDNGFALLGRDLREGRTGFTYYVGRGVSKLAAYTRVPLTGWMFGITTPTSEALGPLKILSRNTTLFALALLAVFSLVLYRIVRSFSDSVSRIERAASASQIVHLGDEDSGGNPADQLDQLAETMSRAVANLESFPEVLIRILGLKDAYTAEHSQTVTQLSVGIGEEMGLGQRELRELACAAVLHDIGKVAIPDAVLGKPGRLTAQEFELIKTHPGVGAQVAEEASIAAPIVEAIRTHQERFDGQGYPAGLAGGEIPLYGRIIAVADAYDAMTSHRPYRPARTPMEVVVEMTRHVGTQFDPEIFLAFQAVLAHQPWYADPCDECDGAAATSDLLA